MFFRFLYPLSFAWILVLLMCQNCAGLRLWEYEPLSLVTTTSDPNKIALNLRIERVSRGEYAVSGTIDIKYDADETTMIEATAHRSNTGDDYSPMPWNLPKQKFEDYIKNHYKEIIYKNMRNCSNNPTPENAYPWPRGTLKYDKCVFKGDGMPDALPAAYYRFFFKVSGEVDWSAEITVRIIEKLDVFG